MLPWRLEMKSMVLLILVALVSSTSGCAVFAVADAAVTVAATTVKVGAKVVGAGVEAMIPDDDDSEEDDE